MTRRYYSSRKQPGQITLDELYSKISNLFLLFRDRDYFKGKAGITQSQAREVYAPPANQIEDTHLMLASRTAALKRCATQNNLRHKSQA